MHRYTPIVLLLLFTPGCLLLSVESGEAPATEFCLENGTDDWLVALEDRLLASINEMRVAGGECRGFLSSEEFPPGVPLAMDSALQCAAHSRVNAPGSATDVEQAVALSGYWGDEPSVVSVVIEGDFEEVFVEIADDWDHCREMMSYSRNRVGIAFDRWENCIDFFGEEICTDEYEAYLIFGGD